MTTNDLQNLLKTGGEGGSSRFVATKVTITKGEEYCPPDSPDELDVSPNDRLFEIKLEMVGKARCTNELFNSSGHKALARAFFWEVFREQEKKLSELKDQFILGADKDKLYDLINESLASVRFDGSKWDSA
jgi:hypothetical protein